MEYKVIFHIDERLRWPMLLGNVENLLAEAVSNKECSQMTVEVVANGDAVLEYAPKGPPAVLHPPWLPCTKKVSLLQHAGMP